MAGKDRATLMARGTWPPRLVKSLASAALCLSIVPIASSDGHSPQSLLLWPGVAPGSEGRASPETVRLNEQGDVSSIYDKDLKKELLASPIRLARNLSRCRSPRRLRPLCPPRRNLWRQSRPHRVQRPERRRNSMLVGGAG